jgi:hypothetical protein
MLSRSRFLAFRAAWIAAVFVGFAANGAPAPQRTPADPAERSNPFPRPEELDQLAGKPLPDSGNAFHGLDVDSWELEGPFPDKLGVVAAAGATDWERLAAEVAKERAGLAVPTDAMHCVARQLGRFHLANDATPANGLQAFIASRCNASVPNYHVGTLISEVPDAVPEEELLGQWREQLANRLGQMMTGGPRTLGIWFGRQAGRAIVMMVVGQRLVHLEPVSGVTDSDGRFELKGEILTPASAVGVMVGRGRFGFKACERDSEVALPRFAFVCMADPKDTRAIASIGFTPPGRLLSKAGLNVLVWPSGEPSARYERPSYGKVNNVSTAQALRSRFIESLNRVRSEAGLEPVSEATNQSAVASELAPHYFAAVRGLAAESDADVIAMGMLAGWSVDGPVESGSFTASWVTQTSDVNRLLSEALQYPGGRAVLLDPDVDQIAVGAVLGPAEPKPVLAAVVGTYTLYSSSEQAANLDRIYEQFQAARSARDREPAERLRVVETLNTAAAGQIQAGMAPNEALSGLLAASAEILQRPVTGWVSEVSSLDDLAFPDDFLDRSDIGISVGVSYHKPAGEAWGRYIVTIVAAEPASHRI